MNCTICGKATPEGTLLCRPCKAALKRARHLTVQEYPVSARRAPLAGGVRGDTPAGPAQRKQAHGRSDANAPARLWESRLLLGAIAIVALTGALYLIEHGYSGSGAATARARPQPLAQPRPADPAPVTASALSAKPSLLPTVTELPEPALPPDRPSASKVAPVRPAPAPRAPAAPRQDPAYAASMANPPLDSFGAAADVPKPAPPPVVVAAPPPPPPDRWQSMSEALNRCAGEGGLSGFICDQRVRLASCEGYWGRVAQCPNPPENPAR
jgi:hypothetical protein